MQEQRRRVRSDNPAERLAAALLIPAELSRRLRLLSDSQLGQLLDEEDAIPGDSYTLEVSSPGVERPLSKLRDFERVVGQKIRLAVRDPIDGQTRFEGRLAEIAANTLQLEISPGRLLPIPLERVQKANLKFEW